MVVLALVLVVDWVVVCVLEVNEWVGFKPPPRQKSGSVGSCAKAKKMKALTIPMRSCLSGLAEGTALLRVLLKTHTQYSAAECLSLHFFCGLCSSFLSLLNFK